MSMLLQLLAQYTEKKSYGMGSLINFFNLYRPGFFQVNNARPITIFQEELYLQEEHSRINRFTGSTQLQRIFAYRVFCFDQ